MSSLFSSGGHRCTLKTHTGLISGKRQQRHWEFTISDHHFFCRVMISGRERRASGRQGGWAEATGNPETQERFWAILTFRPFGFISRFCCASRSPEWRWCSLEGNRVHSPSVLIRYHAAAAQGSYWCMRLHCHTTTTLWLFVEAVVIAVSSTHAAKTLASMLITLGLGCIHSLNFRLYKKSKRRRDLTACPASWHWVSGLGTQRFSRKKKLLDVVVVVKLDFWSWNF